MFLLHHLVWVTLKSEHRWDWLPQAHSLQVCASVTSSLSSPSSFVVQEPVTLIGLTSLWINGRTLVPSKLNRSSASHRVPIPIDVTTNTKLPMSPS
jgi:hypothetical protein